MTEALRVMTCNLRGPDDLPPNDWPRRRPRLVELIRRIGPDLLGTQEALFPRLEHLRADLADLGYRWIGLGREGGSRGEFTAIFYRSPRLVPVAFDHLWLSEQPRLVGSASWGDTANPRMATWVRFADRETGRSWVQINTHLDHQDEEARVRQVGIVRQIIDQHLVAGGRVVVTGDFNAEPGSSPTYRSMAAVLVDTWLAANGPSRRPATFHGYSISGPADGPGAGHIDWIFTSPDVKVVSARVVAPAAAGGTYLSDHWPVVAELTST